MARLRATMPSTPTEEQQRVIDYPREGGGSLLVRGPAGTGKSTALIGRLTALLREGRRPSEILVLVPQRAWADRYERALAQTDGPSRGGVDIVTYYGLSRRDVALFWPLVARKAGFARPDREPLFLTIETAQYHLWRIVEPLVAEKGYFGDLVMRRGRLLSQLIDNLNKAALVGFDYTTLGARLSKAWTGSPDKTLRYVEAQDCAIAFRQHCLAHNLLDFSLVTEVYSRCLMGEEIYQRYWRAHYRHLLVDNLEENVPVAHDLIGWAMGTGDGPGCQSTVLALDEGGGFRILLGADPAGAESVAERCSDRVDMRSALESTENAVALAGAVARSLGVTIDSAPTSGSPQAAVVKQVTSRYWIAMVRGAVRECAALLADGVPADQIALIAPYVSEVMRFAIAEECRAKAIPLRLLRPSSALRDDPIVRGLLVLVLLAHPHWEIALPGVAEGSPSRYQMPRSDLGLALQVALAGLDPVRARRLATAAAFPNQRELAAIPEREERPAGGARSVTRARGLWDEIGYLVRERYEELRLWLQTYRQSPPGPVDLFLARLFGELLCRPGFGFHNDLDKARVYGRLVESAAKFRLAADEGLRGEQAEELGRKYVELVLGGVSSAEYVVDRPLHLPHGVVLAPAYTYLTRDLRSQYQFWLDLSSEGWMNRPYQPLTHPHVLSRRWPAGKPWSDSDEDAAKRESLVRVLRGLAARCSRGVFPAYSDLGIGGEEQAGRLSRAMLIALSRSS